jgi:hypothetical protein
MTDLRQTISDQMGGLEALAMKIPGYSGYKEKEMRREADTLLRQHLAAKLAEQLSRVEAVAAQMLTGPGLVQLAEIGKSNTRLQTLIDKVKTAAQGYSGFFDAIKVKEDELDKLYEFDNQMLLEVDGLAAGIDGIQAALDSGDGSAVGAAVRGYAKAVADVSTHFDQRRDMLTGFSE